MRLNARPGAVLAMTQLLALATLSMAASVVEIVADYSGRQCGGTRETPQYLSITENSTCVTSACSKTYTGDYSTYSSVACSTSDYHEYAQGLYGTVDYLMIDVFAEADCLSFVGSKGFFAVGTCVTYAASGNMTAVVTLEKSGAADLKIFTEKDCGGTPSLKLTISGDVIRNHMCHNGFNRFYSSVSPTSNSSVGSSNGSGGYFTFGNLKSGSESSSSSGSEISSDIQVPLGPDPGAIVERSEGVSITAIVGIAIAYLALCIATVLLCWGAIWRYGTEGTEAN